jgi:DNA repair exonuclease SbcCD ATPase subunit
MPHDAASKLKFPQLERIKLTNFSLYARNPNLNIDLPRGVFCLAGANGLGKSTWLTTLNYALTGFVIDPERKLSRSVEEYFHNVRDFSKEYYSGRIDEDDRDAATVELDFRIGAHKYEVVRGLFEPAELKELTVTQEPNPDHPNNREIIVDGETLTAGERHEKYKELVVEDVGIRYFEQFAFLQHFVLTFDESRMLLLWHQRALEQALFLAFGADYEKAQLADSLRRKVERQDSQVRNYNWRATDVRNQLNLLMEAVDGEEPPTSDELALRQELEDLQDELIRFRNKLDVKAGEVRDTELIMMRLSSERTSLQAEYAHAFTERARQQSRVELHPLIRSSLTTSECSVCATAGSHIVDRIQGALDVHKCPLCDSTIQARTADDEVAERLREIDRRLVRVEHTLAEARQRHERLQNEYQAVRQQLEAVEAQLQEFEEANSSILKRLANRVDRPSSIEERLTSLNALLEDLLTRKEKATTARREARNELRRLQRDIQMSYSDTEERFVPIFRDLALLFLGIDLDVTLVASGALHGGLSLAIELRSIVRREAHQLSESQRFFLDIALRMALARYISGEEYAAPMMIDTPEGSLDIAYESRAGKMFASFVEAGHDLFITANINTSQLLLRLAAECGEDHMKLQRMTSWAELSDVQVDEEYLFTRAYDRIEEAMSQQVDVTRL